MTPLHFALLSMLLCLGLNHRTTPIELRERLAFAESKQPEAAQQIKALPGMEESMVISTCNRVELFSSATHENAEEALAAMQDYLVDHFQLTEAQREALVCYKLSHSAAARHLFRVVSGLDSMVLGETEIFGQVKAAYDVALKAGATGRTLNKLFQRAFSVGKQVRNGTNIQRGSTSVGSVAVDLAEKIFDLRECRVLLIGAGEMSRTCAQSLLSRGAKSIFISNRSYDRAAELAREMGGSALRFDEWEGALHDADIIISSTSAPHFVVKPEVIEGVMRKRHGHSLLIIDIAVPRDVDPLVNEIDEVYLYDVDALQAIADEGRRERERALVRCEEIIEEHLRKFGYHEDSLASTSLQSPESGSPVLPLTPRNS